MSKLKGFFDSVSEKIRSRAVKKKKEREITKKIKHSASKKKNGFSFIGLFSFIILFLYSVSLFVPMIWSLITSFKTNIDYLSNGFGLPEVWVNNYKAVFKYFVVPVKDGAGVRQVGIGEMLFNSIVYSLGGALVSTLASLCAAYACARFNFRFLRVVYAVIIAAMIIPIVGSLPSELAMARSLGLYDSLFGIIIMRTYVVGLHFLIFYASFKSVPKAYSEAAYVDGAGNFQIFTRIMLPMVSGPFITVVLLNFIGNWNDYTTPMVYMPNHPTLAYGLFYFVNGSFRLETSNVPMNLAACMLMAVPLLVIFIVFHKKLLSNVTTGGLKG